MFDEVDPPSPSGALVSLAPLDPEWQPILHISNQVVLYNPTSHALSIRTTPNASLARRASRHCPYCHRTIPTEMHAAQDVDVDDVEHGTVEDDEFTWRPRSRASNYFQLLETANETMSRPATPQRTIPAHEDSSRSTDSSNGGRAFRADNMAEGYFKAFFREEGRLGMGANGTVYLCQHVLDGNSLGHFAVKKIAVGQSHSYLLNILREVRLLEQLHHPNIVTYHHAWMETCQFSTFGPHVPTLHVLMQWAEGGSLDDFIDARLGRRAPTHLSHLHLATTTASGSPSGSASPGPAADTLPSPSAYSRSARIRAFRALQRAPPGERERLRRELGLDGGGKSGGPADWKAVHLLSAEEVRGLFGDIVSGIAFLHDKSILHLDLKPGNVLLTWDEGRLIPRAMLSDFGTSQDMLKSRMRSGNTGTLEYSSPESLPSPTGQLKQVTSKADMWSVGMILHKLLFFRLPYQHASDSARAHGAGQSGDAKDAADADADALEREVQTYAGFRPSSVLATTFQSRRLPEAYLMLLEGLLNINPSTRPTAERVLAAVREGRLDPLSAEASERPGSSGSLIPMPLRRVFDATALLASSISPSPSPDLHAWVSSQEPDAAPLAVREPSAAEKRAREPSAAPTPVPAHARALPFGLSTNGVWACTLSVGGRQAHVRIPRVVWLRTVKSCVLVVKVLSVSRICVGTGTRTGLGLDAHAHPFVAGLLLALAVVDTWFETLMPTLVLGLLHVVAVRLACWSGRCCV